MRQQGGVSTGEGAAAATKGPKRAGDDDADAASQPKRHKGARIPPPFWDRFPDVAARDPVRCVLCTVLFLEPIHIIG